MAIYLKSTFPSTTQEALAIDPERAGELLDTIMHVLDDKMNEYEPPMNVMLACMIYTLDRIDELPDSPFGPAGWASLVPDFEADLAENSETDVL